MQLQDQAVEYDCYEQSVRCSKRNRPALRRNSFPSLKHHNRLIHTALPKCGKTLPHFGGRIPVRDGTLSNMISMPTACPFCRSNRLVTGKLAGGIEESAAYIVLAGVSISFWKGEIKGIVNAVEIEKHAVLCLACGMAWAKADKRSALRLIEGHGSEELKRIALPGGSPDAQPRSDELRQCRPEPDAAPNGGPATQLGNSGGAQGPPSVS